MAGLLSDLSGEVRDLRFLIVDMYIRGDGPSKISDAVRKELKRRGKPSAAFNRQMTQRVLRDVHKYGYLFLRPPLNESERSKLADWLEHEPQDTHVVDVESALKHDVLDVLDVGTADAIQVYLAFQAVVNHAGDVAFHLINAIGQRKKVEGDGTPQVVHVGIGAGLTTRLVCGRLARLLRTEHPLLDDHLPRMHKNVSKIVFHAISSGFDPLRPLNAPTAIFTLFEDSRIETQFIGLFTNAVVPSDQFDMTKTLPGVVEPFERREEIEFVISSFASERSQRGLWNKYARADTNVESKLGHNGWVGDFQFRPYSPEGPITEDIGIRAVTLFELSDFVDFPQQDKQVLLVAPPGKSDALYPLLTQPSLKVWTHLVTDVRTAEKIRP